MGLKQHDYNKFHFRVNSLFKSFKHLEPSFMKKKKHLLIIPFYLKMSQIMEVNYIVKQI